MQHTSSDTESAPSSLGHTGQALGLKRRLGMFEVVALGHGGKLKPFFTDAVHMLVLQERVRSNEPQ